MCVRRYALLADVRAAASYLYATGAYEPDTTGWAVAACAAWAETSTRHIKHYHPCGKIFCAANCCMDLPGWLRTPAELRSMAARLDARLPEWPSAKAMEADALVGVGEPEAAGRAYMQAAQRCGPEQADFKKRCLERARRAFAIVQEVKAK